MIIDSHQHFWNYEPEKHSWIDEEMSVIRRDFLSDDLQKVFTENGVDACVAVQADQTTEETDFLISLSDACLPKSLSSFITSATDLFWFWLYKTQLQW